MRMTRGDKKDGNKEWEEFQRQEGFHCETFHTTALL